MLSFGLAVFCALCVIGLPSAEAQTLEHLSVPLKQATVRLDIPADSALSLDVSHTLRVQTEDAVLSHAEGVTGVYAPLNRPIAFWPTQLPEHRMALLQTPTPSSHHGGAEGSAMHHERSEVFWTPTLNNVALLTLSAVMLVAGPAAAYGLVNDISATEATMLAYAGAAGVLSLGLGALSISAGAILVVLSGFMVFLSEDGVWPMLLAGGFLASFGVLMLAVSPFAFEWGYDGVRRDIGQPPANSFGSALISVMTSAVVGGSVAMLVLNTDADGWVQGIVIASSMLLASALTFTLMQDFDSEPTLPPMSSDMTAPEMMAPTMTAPLVLTF